MNKVKTLRQLFLNYTRDEILSYLKKNEEAKTKRKQMAEELGCSLSILREAVKYFEELGELEGRKIGKPAQPLKFKE